MDSGTLPTGEVVTFLRDELGVRVESDKHLICAEPDFVLGIMLSALESIGLVEHVAYYRKLGAGPRYAFSFMEKFFITREALALLGAELSLLDFLPLNPRKMRQLFSAIVRFCRRVRELQSGAAAEFAALAAQQTALDDAAAEKAAAEERLAAIEAERAAEQSEFAQITAEIDALGEELRQLEAERRKQESERNEAITRKTAVESELRTRRVELAEANARVEHLNSQIVGDHLEIAQRAATLSAALTAKRDELRGAESAIAEKEALLAKATALTKSVIDARDALTHFRERQIALSRLQEETRRKESELAAEEEELSLCAQTETHLIALLEQERSNLEGSQQQHSQMERLAEEERLAAVAVRDRVWKELAARNKDIEAATAAVKRLADEKQALETRANIYAKSMEAMHATAKAKLEDYCQYLTQTLSQN